MYLQNTVPADNLYNFKPFFTNIRPTQHARFLISFLKVSVTFPWYLFNKNLMFNSIQGT
jgi:hypothetical protein